MPPPASTSQKSIEDVIGAKGDRSPPAQPAAPGNASVEAVAPALSAIAGAPGRPGEPMNPREVKSAMDKYFERVGNFAGSWDQLIKAKFLTGVPLDIHGKPLNFGECMEWFASGK